MTMASASQIGGLIVAYASEQAAEEFTSCIPYVGSLATGVMSLGGTYFFLKNYLEKMEEVALLVLKEASENLPID